MVSEHLMGTEKFRVAEILEFPGVSYLVLLFVQGKLKNIAAHLEVSMFITTIIFVLNLYHRYF